MSSSQRSRRSGKRGGQMQVPFAPQQIQMPLASEMAYAQQQQQMPQYIPQIQQQQQYMQPMVGFQQFMPQQGSQEQYLLEKKIALLEEENNNLVISCDEHRKRIQYLEDRVFELYSKFEELQRTHPLVDENREAPQKSSSNGFLNRYA